MELDPTHVAKMTEALRQELNKTKALYEKECKDRKLVQDSLEEKETLFNSNHTELLKLREHMDGVKREKR